MNEAIKALDLDMQREFEDYMDLVVINYQYLSSIGVEKPEALIPHIPHLFVRPTEFLAKKFENVDIDLLNEDPNLVIELL